MKKKWWKEIVAYQVYPRGFMDTNNDGIGDIKGITNKLEYFSDLGIGMIWICPVCKSPNDDNGYDISDYKEIMNEFGTMADVDELLEKAHAMGLKVMLDFVFNHSSDEHEWFVESRKSKDNPKRDYYIWRPSEDNKEPNNWGSYFSPSAWEYDELTDEYYLHLFSKKQPDINWENPKAREEIYEAIRWWLDKGVDGLRFDAINAISKAEGFPDIITNNPSTAYVFEPSYYLNRPGVHTFVQEMRREALSKYDVVSVGETGYVDVDMGIKYSNQDESEFDMLFQFEHVEIDGMFENRAWKLTELKNILTKWQIGLHNKGWCGQYFGNHDRARMVSRYGNAKQYREESAKMLATLLLTLEGTPFIYQGDEIGMTNIKLNKADDYKDIQTSHAYNMLTMNKNWSHDKTMLAIQAQSRGNSRTPVQWNSSKNAGFTKGTPWMEVNPNYEEINVERDLKNENSILNYYKKMIEVRKQNQELIYGDFSPLYEESEEFYAYIRTLEEQKILVILSFSANEVEFSIPTNIKDNSFEILISNYKDSRVEQTNQKILLKPYEALVFKLKGL